MLAKVASHYGSALFVAIDPHNSPILLDRHTNPEASSYKDFLHSIHAAGVSDHVEPHVAYSTDVANSWSRPIRLLWIDGDHSMKVAKKIWTDSFPPGPRLALCAPRCLKCVSRTNSRVCKDVLRSDRFGPAGFVHSIAWVSSAGRRPCVREPRSSLARRARA